MQSFNPTSSRPARAVQAWQILICKATNRQTITYEGLSLLMFKREAAGVLGPIVGHIGYYCQDNGIPILTAIVVGKTSGTPGEGVLVDPANLDEERERVYNHDWFNIYPPSEGEFSAAYSEVDPENETVG